MLKTQEFVCGRERANLRLQTGAELTAGRRPRGLGTGQARPAVP